jgi:hypothetical protein
MAYIVANSRASLSAWRIGPARGRVVSNGFDAERLPSRVADAWSDEGPFTVVMAALPPVPAAMPRAAWPPRRKGPALSGRRLP